VKVRAVVDQTRALAGEVFDIEERAGRKLIARRAATLPGKAKGRSKTKTAKPRKD